MVCQYSMQRSALRKCLYRKLMISKYKQYRINKRISIFPCRQARVVAGKNYGRKVHHILSLGLPSSFIYVPGCGVRSPGRQKGKAPMTAKLDNVIADH
jgi:hypothetical protein